MKKIFLSIFPIILIDQILKIYIKTHFELGKGIPIFSFFWIFFVENPGMAYGISIAPGYFGKIFLSFFRFIVVLFIFFFLYKNIKKKSSNYLIIPTIFILSGAIGNLLDSFLYGLLFDTGTIYNQESHKWISYSGISNIFPWNGGYASFMKGCVVDMFYFPIFDIYIPYWTPFFGGYNFKFFKPVFNFSDFIISIGIILLLIFKKKIKHVKIF
ncbi:lipoprotein signal peptidase [Blattabacterium punctulatus]|uniref:lipoprotein signal peptidase n=1 Tax=Blattabacterium punctulatus TaxID=164514 RepID=UPI000D7C1D59|nr:lipoprotein signal peptidase [Blattabacterium punctulatus]AWU43075.1 lipoprotein signal peptidase [Blattabacterium punctulatus]